jgi:hypothetical protein
MHIGLGGKFHAHHSRKMDLGFGGICGCVFVRNAIADGIRGGASERCVCVIHRVAGKLGIGCYRISRPISDTFQFAALRLDA